MDLLLYHLTEGAIAALGFALFIYPPVTWLVSGQRPKKDCIWYIDDGGRARRE